jgi:hypothetical protein
VGDGDEFLQRPASDQSRIGAHARAGIRNNHHCRLGIGGFATGRFTTLEEVATLITILASERTANVTGVNSVIDGGLIKTT